MKQMNLFSAHKAAVLLAFLSLLFALSSQPAFSQIAANPDPDERKAVLAVVQAFFDTMAAKDVEGAARTLIRDGRFYSVREVDGEQVTRTFTNQEYLDGLPKEQQRVRERMWNPDVHVRGRIATVWTPYDFWIDGELSHCGIDSFNLIKSGEGWKIAGGIYTVERKCEPSPLGPLKE